MLSTMLIKFSTVMSSIPFLDNTDQGVTSSNSVCSLFTDTDANNTFISILRIARTVVRILQIVVPILLIVLGSIDIAKAVIAGDEKKIKEAQKPFVKRIIAAVIVFLVPWIVGIVLNLVGGNAWKACWSAAGENNSGYSSPITDPLDPWNTGDN